MKVVVAIDSFKGSLSSLQAGRAVEQAIHRLDDTAQVVVKPVADGGEGTVEALAETVGAEMSEVVVNGPSMKPVLARYCILKDTHTAVIEIASAAGITLIADDERNPLVTTTFGVGELIKDAIGKGCRRFIVGLGGSATNDGGVGMLTALGYEFLDAEGHPIEPGAKGLCALRTIKVDKAMPELKECRFQIACDVINPLCGENGCSAVFGPQKGATSQMVSDMDGWLEAYATLAKKVLKNAEKDHAGAGAAGGLGFAFLSFTNATLQAGIDIVLNEIGIETDIKNADIVVTGEGRLDAQTVMGKVPVGVAKLAKKYAKRVIAFSGCATDDAEICNEHGIDAFFPILRNVTTLEEALDSDNAYKNVSATAYQVFRLLM